jgi:hypothetical protein
MWKAAFQNGKTMDLHEALLFVLSYLALFALIGLYLVPAWTAIFRAHPRRGHILLLNLLLGWTIAGWVAALLWALRPFDPPPRSEVNDELEIERLLLPCKPDYDFRTLGHRRSGSGDLLARNP